MQLEISKCYFFATSFIAAHQNFMTTLATMVNKNACQTTGISWHLVPSTTYSIKKFSKHSCVPGRQFKQRVKAPGPLIFTNFKFETQ